MKLENGLYERLINKELQQLIKENADKKIVTAPVDEAEQPKRLSMYLEALLRQRFSEIKEEDQRKALINKLIYTIEKEDVKPDSKSIDVFSELLSVQDSFALPLARPETPLSVSTIFTAAKTEPKLISELINEIRSADRIDFLVSFIRWSALRILIPALTDFTERGGRLRILTTSYMGASEPKALDVLSRLPNTELLVSYDSQNTRMHAKAYLFHRNTGYSTAIIGSSNLSKAAMTEGLEWNMKITKQDLPDLFEKASASFDTYWEGGSFEAYDPLRFRREIEAANRVEDRHSPFFADLKPYLFQQEILDELETERELYGKNHNLVVAATGTGKTMIAAFDYRRLKQKKKNGYPRLLFVAHRKEILEQSLFCFRNVLRDENFGSLQVGEYVSADDGHLFISIQSLNSRGLTETYPEDYYDYIVIDEFHHAAAKSYQKLLAHFKPQILLGLTATPERLDGKDILSYFDERIAAEIRLPEAVDRGLLSPFQYFCVTDPVDLSKASFRQGQYDVKELENLYTLDAHYAKKRAHLILEKTAGIVSDIHEVVGVGFCVSKAHARFMADIFNEAGVKSAALTSEDTAERRHQIHDALISGTINFVFVVDLYNEGVDIPQIDTVLFLRPTQSLTVFLQQLGRGLRLFEGKECLTVIDFIGQAHRQYRFEDKFQALLTRTSPKLENEIEGNFPSLPQGCYLQMEKLAREYVLKNIKQAVIGKKWLQDRILSMTKEEPDLTFSRFLKETGVDPRKIYKTKMSFYTLRGILLDRPVQEPDEKLLVTALSRIAKIDSVRWMDFLIGFLPEMNRTYPDLSRLEQCYLHMFWGTLITNQAFPGGEKAYDALDILRKKNPVLWQEIIELLQYQRGKIKFRGKALKDFQDFPLDLYCSYSKMQILLALGDAKAYACREGVKWLADSGHDVLLNTLNKSEKDYSESTMYQDYALSEHLFHWQSQSTTSEDSPTGIRYQRHEAQGSDVLLFVREHKNSEFGAENYAFLGPVSYQSHTGSCPMSIIWKTDYPIPARLLKETARLMAG